MIPDRHGRPRRLLLHGMLSCAALGLSLLGTAGSAAASPIATSVASAPSAPVTVSWSGPQMPPADAPLSTWQAWGERQSLSIRQAPWAHELASQGARLLSVSYVEVTTVPGLPIPRGVTSTAAVLDYAHAATSPAVAASTPASGASTCRTITGPGPDCIAAVADPPGDQIQASYTYYGSSYATGHVMLGIDGCPGGAAANGSNVTLGYGYGQLVAYGPVDFSDTWSSTWWQYTGAGGYSSWGTVCASY